jgi:hypothetical protein
MELIGYSIGEGEQKSFETPLPLHPGETITTPPIKVGDLPHYDGRKETNVDLIFRLEPLHGGEAEEMTLRAPTSVEKFKMTGARYQQSEMLPRGCQARIDIALQGLHGYNVHIRQPEFSITNPITGEPIGLGTTHPVPFKPTAMASPTLPFAISKIYPPPPAYEPPGNVTIRF